MAIEIHEPGLVGEVVAAGVEADHKHSLEDAAGAGNDAEYGRAGTCPLVLGDNHFAYHYHGVQDSYCDQMKVQKDLADDNCNDAFRFA